MKIIFVSIALNIHQVYLADELYTATKGQFQFIETSVPKNDSNKGGSYDFSNRPYLIRSYESWESCQKALDLIRDADVMIYGAAPISMLKERIKTGKLTFINSERWLKRGWFNLLSPNLIKHQWLYHAQSYRLPVYVLCSSAFASSDYLKLHSYNNRCFKWGYFTKVQNPFLREYSIAGEVKLMWCARFLKLKHPELPVLMAYQLKEEGYKFHLDMYGAGPKERKTISLAKNLNLDDVVSFHGSRPNEDVVGAMMHTDIFLFTSNRQEGWGAVANESMSSGCVLVSSDEVGSAPYLIKDGVTGIKFKSGNVNDLTQKVKYLLDNRTMIKKIGIAGREYLATVWSPKNAAQSLLQLISYINGNNDKLPIDGPCSKA